MENNGPAVSSFGLDKHGIEGVRAAYWNLPPARLVEMAVQRGEAILGPTERWSARRGRTRAARRTTSSWSKTPRSTATSGGATSTGRSSGRSFEALRARALEYLKGKDVFVFDGYAGADPRYRLNVRVITEDAWHNLFARNMFMREEDPAILAELRAQLHGDQRRPLPGRAGSATAPAARRSSCSTSPSAWC